MTIVLPLAGGKTRYGPRENHPEITGYVHTNNSSFQLQHSTPRLTAASITSNVKTPTVFKLNSKMLQIF